MVEFRFWSVQDLISFLQILWIKIFEDIGDQRFVSKWAFVEASDAYERNVREVTKTSLTDVDVKGKADRLSGSCIREFARATPFHDVIPAICTT